MIDTDLEAISSIVTFAMSQVSDLEKINHWLKAGFRKENIVNFQVLTVDVNKEGGGNMGEIEFIEVKATTDENETKTYNFVMKTGQKPEAYRKFAPIRHAFLNETFVYDHIFPAYLDFQKRKKAKNLFQAYPKCHGTVIDETLEVIFLQNLKVLGYEVHDKLKPMSMQQVEMVLKEFAKFHGISFAYKDQHPEKYKKIVGSFFPVFKQFSDAFDLTVTMQENLRHGFNHGKAVNADVSNKVADLIELIPDIYPAFIAGVDGPDTVIIHGDVWNDNFMFKYTDDGDTPEAVCLIDWQNARSGSPVFDISGYLFGACSKDGLDQIDVLLELYHNVLSDTIRELGSDPQAIYPKSKLMEDWTTYGKFGAIIGPMILKFISAEREEFPDFSKSEDGVNKAALRDYNANDASHFHRRLLELITHPTYLSVI